MDNRFQDRRAAGRSLARSLAHHARLPDVLVLGLPRGGVPVAYEVAIALDAPLDVFVVRKLGVPGQEELAFGAIARGGVRVLNAPVVDALGIPDEVIEGVAAREARELERRERTYRGGRPSPEVVGRRVILVDDGIATGSTMRVAVESLRRLGARRLTVAVPTASPEAADRIRPRVEEFVALLVPEGFLGVGQWYDDFSQTTDAEVCRLLSEANGRHPGSGSPAGEAR